MDATAGLTKQEAVSFDCLQLGGGWQARVLLHFCDDANLLPRPWPKADRADWKKVLPNPSGLFRQDPGVHLKRDGRSSRVLRRKVTLGSAEVEVFCKQSRRRNLLRKGIGLFRRTRPSRNWQVGWELLEAGVPTALPVAFFEKRLLGLKIAAGIVTQSLLPGKTLKHFVLEDGPGLSEEQLTELTEKLAGLISRLHKKGFFHRDLKGKNIFVHFDQEQGSRFFLLDLDGCRPDGGGLLNKAKSLGRLARASLVWPTVRRTVRLRFLRAYLHGLEEPWADWKKWWRSIDRQVCRKLPAAEKK